MLAEATIWIATVTTVVPTTAFALDDDIYPESQGEPPNSLYYARFHPHLHAIVADGLFRRNGTFYVFPKCDRSRILAMLKCKGKIVKRSGG